MLLGVLTAVPVGLGLAAVLLVAAGPPSANPLTQGSQAGTAPPGADEALPPAADDFFDDQQTGSAGQDSPGTAGGGDAGADQGGDAPGPDAVVEDDTTLAPSEQPEEEGEDGQGADSDDGSPDGGSGDGSGGSSGGGSQVSALAQQVVELANEERAEAGCDPLSADSRLTAASEAHTRDMAERDYMAHESPEGEGPAERAQEAGYDAWSGENVAAGYTSAADVVEGWMNSPGHRRNILDCGNTEVGVAETDTKWAQNFGTG